MVLVQGASALMFKGVLTLLSIICRNLDNLLNNGKSKVKNCLDWITKEDQALPPPP